MITHKNMSRWVSITGEPVRKTKKKNQTSKMPSTFLMTHKIMTLSPNYSKTSVGHAYMYPRVYYCVLPIRTNGSWVYTLFGPVSCAHYNKKKLIIYIYI